MDLGNDNELVETIFQVTRGEQHFIQKRLKQHHLNMRQAQTLNFISHHPGAIQKELSRYLGKPEATTTNIIKALEARDLISRQITKDNERQKQLFLAPEGQVLVQSVRQIFIDLDEHVSIPVTSEEKQVLLSLLTRIQTTADFEP